MLASLLFAAVIEGVCRLLRVALGAGRHRALSLLRHIFFSLLLPRRFCNLEMLHIKLPLGEHVNAHVHADISTLGILVERRTLHPIGLFLNPGSRNPLSKPARSLCDGRSRSTAVPTLAHVCRRRTVCLLRALKVHSTLLRYPHGPFHNRKKLPWNCSATASS